jgi:hypothetical protein
MSRHLHLLPFVTAIALAGIANADDGGSRRLAQAPGAIADKVVAPCLTQDVSALSLMSDFSVYMAANCPTDVRIKALRHLWPQMPSASDPDRVFGENR